MKKIVSAILCLFLLLSCMFPAMAATGVPEPVMEATKSVVRILSQYRNGAATGSGFVIQNLPGEALIVTNNHVVEGNPYSISIWVGEDKMVDAEIVFTTSEQDLCVLKVTDPIDMKPLKLSREEPQHGGAIYVVGYPGAGDILSDTQAHTSNSVTITDGIISAIRNYTIEEGGRPVKLLQVNAAINSGNSGGPLFDSDGVVIGVNTYKVNANSQGVFGSVAISELWTLLEKHGIAISEESADVVISESEEIPLLPMFLGAGVVLLLLLTLALMKRKKKAIQGKKKLPTVTLRTYMEQYPAGLEIGQAVSLLLPVAIQLRNLHNEGRLHLQVCPETISIRNQEGTLKKASDKETGRFNSGFAAPEIYRGAGFGITSDVYSFAAVLLYAVTGTVPANSLQAEDLARELDALEDVAFRESLRKAMAANIVDRTQSMQELIYSIAVFNTPVQKPVSKPQEPRKAEAPAPHRVVARKKPKHKPKLLPIAAVLAGVALGIFLWPGASTEPDLRVAETTVETTMETTQPLSPEELAYQEAEALLANGETAKAAIAFGKLAGYSDARERSFALWREDLAEPKQTVFNGGGNWFALKNDGTVVQAGNSHYAVDNLTNIVAFCDNHFALKADGTCVSILNSRSVEDWTDIVSVKAAQGATIGLKTDGTVVAVGANDYGQCNVEDWTDIVAIEYGASNTLGLKVDGTVMTTGWNKDGQCDVVEDWTDIVAIESNGIIFGLKVDGTVVTTTGLNTYGQCDVEDWTDIIAIESNGAHTSGLKSDGTVVATGLNKYGLCDVEDWADIVAIESTWCNTFGLKSDGTVVVTGTNQFGLCNVEDWTDIVAIITSYDEVMGLKSDGTVVFISNKWYAPEIRSWSDIRLPN